MDGRRDVVLRSWGGRLVRAPGPRVVLGVRPGPDGVRLPAERGVADEHVWLVTDRSGAVVHPQADCAVRIAMRAPADWRTLPPVAGSAVVGPGMLLAIGRADDPVLVRIVDLPCLGDEASQMLGPAPRPWGIALAAALAWVAGVGHFAACGAALWAVGRRPTASVVEGPVALAVDPALEAVVAARAAAWLEDGTLARLDRVRPTLDAVAASAAERGLPALVAAIPWVESRYSDEATSELCAAGRWQLMPEVGVRGGLRAGVDFAVRSCRLRGAPGLWSPTRLAPPRNVAQNSVYADASGCRIVACERDDRRDAERSTVAALALLADAWADVDLRASPIAEALLVATHHAGHDDAALDGEGGKSTNVRPALLRLRDGCGGESDWTTWVGGCPGESPGLLPSTQAYVVDVLAVAQLAGLR